MATPAPARRTAHLLLRLAAAAGLAVDAAVHARLAERYDAVGDTLSQGTLFRAEAAAASLAVLLVLLLRRRTGDLFGWLVAASGLGALLLYRYVDVGPLGPLPNMYEPFWFADKTLAAWAEGVALVALTVLLSARGRR
ncbi:hypothetical protein [Streptomyces sp. CBMA123]|uniref:hypothetical protein n=1 Tax=Streptomyces sp. CBMA123 TaxID=1896313 RepID=UPI0016620187|nr:hypothetical protein [Streptomyces sp. CBMA123]